MAATISAIRYSLFARPALRLPDVAGPARCTDAVFTALVVPGMRLPDDRHRRWPGTTLT